MPIYEYACRRCGHGFEHLMRTRNEAPPACPACGAAKPRKQLSAFSPLAAGFAADFGDTCPTCPSAVGGGCRGGACPMAS